MKTKTQDNFYEQYLQLRLLLQQGFSSNCTIETWKSTSGKEYLMLETDFLTTVTLKEILRLWPETFITENQVMISK